LSSECWRKEWRHRQKAQAQNPGIGAVMKTKYRFIEFKSCVGSWRCFNTKDPSTLLGEIAFYSKWREWEFLPNPGTGYTIECLRDIADFIGQLPKA
jgi:hypothetical protein